MLLLMHDVDAALMLLKYVCYSLNLTAAYHYTEKRKVSTNECMSELINEREKAVFEIYFNLCVFLLVRSR